MSDLSRTNLVNLAKAANVSLSRLATGNEDIFQGSKETPQDSHVNDYVYIPTYDIEVSAGGGAFTEGTKDVTKHLAFRWRWIKARGY